MRDGLAATKDGEVRCSPAGWPLDKALVIVIMRAYVCSLTMAPDAPPTTMTGDKCLRTHCYVV